MSLRFQASALFCFLCLTRSRVRGLVTLKSRLGIFRPSVTKAKTIAMMRIDINQRTISDIDAIEVLLSLCRKNRSNILSAILTANYISIVLSVYTLPVCLSAIYADSNFMASSSSSNVLSKIVSVANISNLTGKFILGPSTDYLGGDITMLITLLLSAVSLLGCSVSANIQTFGAFWILFSFVFSAAWGAISKIVRERFEKQDWALQLGLIYTGSRVGSMLSSLLFSRILRPKLTSSVSGSLWRAVFRTSSLILAFMIFISTLVFSLIGPHKCDDLHHCDDKLVLINSNRTITKSDSRREVRKTAVLIADSSRYVRAESVREVLSRLTGDETFWLLLISKISFVSVRQFAAFLPFYLTTGFSINPSSAVFASTSFAFGSLLSSAIGTRLYYRLSGLCQIKVISVCNFFGFFLPGILWAHHSSSTLLKNFLLPRQVVLLIISLWGIFWSLPFGPSGALTLALCGENHVALLINLSDAAGLLCASVLSYYAVEYGKVGNWGPILFGLSISGAVALPSMYRIMMLQLGPSRDNL